MCSAIPAPIRKKSKRINNVFSARKTYKSKITLYLLELICSAIFARNMNINNFASVIIIDHANHATRTPVQALNQYVVIHLSAIHARVTKQLDIVNVIDIVS